MSDIQKYQPHEIVRANNAVKLTNKLLAVTNTQLIPYRKGDKWGFCTPDKKMVIDYIYEEVTLFYEYIAAVKLNNKWGFINKKGTIVIPFIYDDLEFNDGLFKALVGNKWGLLDKKGAVLIPFIYDSIYFDNNKINLHIEGEWIYVDRNNKPIAIESKKPTENKFRAVKSNNKYGFEDKNGNVAIPFIYDYLEYIHPFSSSDFVVAKNDNKWGIIDTKGNVILSCLYSFEQLGNGFSVKSNINNYDLCPIKLGMGLGYADSKGSVVIPCIYDQDDFRLFFDEPTAFGNEDEVYRYFTYNDLVFGNFIIIKKNGKRGLIDRQGNTIIPCKYDELKFYSTQKGFPYNIVRVYLNKKEGYVGMDGTEYWED